MKGSKQLQLDPNQEKRFRIRLHLEFMSGLLLIIEVMLVPFSTAQIGRMGQMGGSSYQGTFESYNKFGLPSLIIPVPCQANKLQEQVNYICAHGNIWCLPGWKVFIFNISFIIQKKLYQISILLVFQTTNWFEIVERKELLP